MGGLSDVQSIGAHVKWKKKDVDMRQSLEDC